jgi:hypothetical protein
MTKLTLTSGYLETVKFLKENLSNVAFKDSEKTSVSAHERILFTYTSQDQKRHGVVTMTRTSGMVKSSILLQTFENSYSTNLNELTLRRGVDSYSKTEFTFTNKNAQRLKSITELVDEEYKLGILKAKRKVEEKSDDAKLSNELIEAGVAMKSGSKFEKAGEHLVQTKVKASNVYVEVNCNQDTDLALALKEFVSNWKSDK